jgi:hypothetical protein
LVSRTTSPTGNPNSEIRDPKENRGANPGRFHPAARPGGAFSHRASKLVSAIGDSDFGIQVQATVAANQNNKGAHCCAP